MGLTNRGEQLVVDVNLKGRRLDKVRSLIIIQIFGGTCESEIRSRVALGKPALRQIRTKLRNLVIHCKNNWQKYRNFSKKFYIFLRKNKSLYNL